MAILTQQHALLCFIENRLPRITQTTDAEGKLFLGWIQVVKIKSTNILAVPADLTLPSKQRDESLLLVYPALRYPL